MRKIAKHGDPKIPVCPRFPYRHVFVEDAAYEAFLKAQNLLTPHQVHLVLARGFENQGLVLKVIHAIARIIGASVFCCLYPSRANEVWEIFSANGHDKNGRCVDLSLRYQGKDIMLLPRGVFTHERTRQNIQQEHDDLLRLVWRTLETVGFVIHANKIEALQIHCELVL